MTSSLMFDGCSSSHGGCFASTVKPFQVSLVEPVAYLMISYSWCRSPDSSGINGTQNDRDVRYSHLGPSHQKEAIERLVSAQRLKAVQTATRSATSDLQRISDQKTQSVQVH